MMRDQDFGVIRLRAFGTYDFKVIDPRLFLKEVVGTDQNFRLDEFADTMRSRLVSVFTDSLATAKVPALDVASRYGELGDALLPVINPVVSAKYGLEISSFVIENVSVPPEVEEAIDKRSSMSAIGNLNDYVKYQMGQGMAKGGGAGPGGTAAEMAIGFGMAQEMMKQSQTTAPSGGMAPAAKPQAAELMGIPEVASYLGVSEADVMASITAGDLKAKKIGSAYRITRAAVDAFLAQ
jgi:excisionase family DNA binding protein